MHNYLCDSIFRVFREELFLMIKGCNPDMDFKQASDDFFFFFFTIDP